MREAGKVLTQSVLKLLSLLDDYKLSYGNHRIIITVRSKPNRSDILRMRSTFLKSGCKLVWNGDNPKKIIIILNKEIFSDFDALLTYQLIVDEVYAI